MKVGFVSLGCSKNLVDTEKTIDIFKKHGYDIVNNPKEVSSHCFSALSRTRIGFSGEAVGLSDLKVV